MFPGIITTKGHAHQPLNQAIFIFHTQPFRLDGVWCSSLESFFQSLKCPDVIQQRIVCHLSRKKAARVGQRLTGWKRHHMLHWNGTFCHRSSEHYQHLIARAYDARFAEDDALQQLLTDLDTHDLWLSINRSRLRDTPLTEAELIAQIYRLQWRSFSKHLQPASA